MEDIAAKLVKKYANSKEYFAGFDKVTSSQATNFGLNLPE
jgi:hypothetical protein